MSTVTAPRLDGAPRVQPAPLDEATLERLYRQARLTDRPTKASYLQPAIPLEPAARRDVGPVGEQVDTERLPDPGTWAYRLVPAVLECLVGLRPVTQLARMMSCDLRRRLARQSAISRRRGVRGVRAPQVLKVHVCRPTPAVAEVAVVVRVGGRSRAVALRLEGLDDRWMMTSFTYG